MKKILLICAVIFLGICATAFTVIEYATATQMDKYAGNIIEYYNFDKGHNKLTLGDITCSVPNSVMPDSLFDKVGLHKYDSIYHNWITDVVFGQRKTLVDWVTKERITQLLKRINKQMVDSGNTFGNRDSLFKELKSCAGYYCSVLSKLQLATPAQRTAIFTELAKIAPATRAQDLVSALDDVYPKPNYVGIATFNKLKKNLSNVGIVVHDRCSDFDNYKFARVSRQYDYLVSLLRWSTYIDGGVSSDVSISGWKETTIKSLIDDALVLANKTSSTINAYKPN